MKFEELSFTVTKDFRFDMRRLRFEGISEEVEELLEVVDMTKTTKLSWPPLMNALGSCYGSVTIQTDMKCMDLY